MVFDLLINLLMSRHLIMTWLGSEEGGRKQRERERYKELDRECVKERREIGDR